MERPVLEALVRRAGAQNARVGITGLLLYGAGHFMQLLEGDVFAVERLFDRIAEDPRHQHVRRLAFAALPQRAFGAWHMGLLNLDERHALDRRRLQAVSDLFDQPRVTGSDVQRGLALLREFSRQLAAPG